ncbi:hypothetical protein [Saccharothrix texasensis]|uniref:Uncharacterized protein n=1 Tax=Saccharothrix texasensis TaxID=103734 RepID=A0A3N1H295_9PSEU|nr:hypothetical protein [Saccharothrix texasensis]ROP36372.1 hypothetical protein EDD40_1638 [Saccharothrix texasensis]
MNAASRSVNSPRRTRPAAPQHVPSTRNTARSSRPRPSGRRTSSSRLLRARPRRGTSDSRATASGRRAGSATACGSAPPYSQAAGSGSCSAGAPVGPLVMELITAVSGSSDAQQVRSVGTTRSTTSIAARCSSATPRPADTSAAISRAVADRSYRRTMKTHLSTAGEGFELNSPDARITVKVDAAHTLTVHSPSVQFLAFSLTDAMGRFFRDVDRAVPADTPPAEAAPVLREVVGRHGITMGEWSS